LTGTQHGIGALQDSISLEGFLQQLESAGRGLLMLDYDGTLAPLQCDPAAAVPYPGVQAALDRILAQGRTHLAIVTGRSLAQGLPMPPLAAPVEIWGAHGHERRRIDGRCESLALPTEVISGLVMVDEWIEAATAAGARCERKPASVAFHWRGQSSAVASSLRELLAARWHEGRLSHVLRWLDLECGVEITAPNGTKGVVVDALLGEHYHVPAAFLGDDLPDEEAFLSVRQRGIGILVRPERRLTAADFWCRPPGDLLQFLDAWCESLDGHRQ
jgi:trehalose-phosphatase